MTKVILVLCMFASANAEAFAEAWQTQANEVHGKSGARAHVLVDAPTAPACWYQGQRYSEGALLIMEDILKICARKQPQHENGPLMWRSVDAKGEPIYPQLKHKIRVN
ncbi:DUF1496 domain-containing protein [Pseudoalteromonas sp. T1lg48]|uniref:DUF1496 domain-containing protein n=1 Tax=Pseudoalteromonas sp. T1lg48 TaxID=2077100 RepID=UPI001319BA26|nr:DUF1496 domain-containing protein [Pseudoalteromonas sp. T1lg48]